jgi:hypothetical protein
VSYTTKEAFGGNTRFERDLKARKIKVIETKGVISCPSITGISKMPLLENAEFINIVVEWYNEKKCLTCNSTGYVGKTEKCLNCNK